MEAGRTMTKSEARRTAQAAGEAARQAGEPRGANPYWGDPAKWGDAPLDVMHKAWNKGWDTADRAAEAPRGVVASALEMLGITHASPPPLQTRARPRLPREATHWPDGEPIPEDYVPPQPREVPCPCCRRVRRDNGVSAVRYRKRSADHRWAYFVCEVCRERRCAKCHGAMFQRQIRYQAGGPLDRGEA